MPISRKTQQKELIQKCIDSQNSFFSAEELYEIVSKKDSTIGIATVYRYLKDLRDSQKIYSFFCNRSLVYSTEERIHCHVICEVCGRQKHIHLNDLGFVKEKVTKQATRVLLEVYDICENCKE